jgi:fibronectin type 3 domain-containing protein
MWFEAIYIFCFAITVIVIYISSSIQGQAGNGEPYDFYLTARLIWNTQKKRMAQIQGTYLLTPPANFKAITGQESATIALSWSPVPNATGYEIQRAPTNDNVTEFTTIATISSDQTTSYIDKLGLVNGETYNYRIAAIDNRLTSAFSSIVSATPQLTPPANFKAMTGHESATIALSWSPVTNATGYGIHRASLIDGVKNFSRIAIIFNAQTTTYVDKLDLVNGETYDYKIAAMDSRLRSAFSSIVAATPQLTPPANFKAMTCRESATITLSWSPVTNATGYGIHRASPIDGVKNFSRIAIIFNAQTTTYVDKVDLVNGETYDYKIAAMDSRLRSAFSSTVSATLQLTLPTIFKTISIRKGDLTKENVGRENRF